MPHPIARLIASGLGVGYAPRAPGTAGSALGLVLGAGLIALHPLALPVAAILALAGGWWAITQLGVGAQDPGWVVIDEVAGQFFALLGLAQFSIAGFAAAFLLFRLLDILKPGPIGWADRQHNAAGIMADDVLAGAAVGVVLWAIRSQWPGILQQSVLG